MAPKRSRLEIYVDVLRIINKGTKKPTRIMYKTNLSWRPLIKTLESLLSQELITRIKQNNHVTFEISDKGKDVLNHFDKALKMVEIE